MPEDQTAKELNETIQKEWVDNDRPMSEVVEELWRKSRPTLPTEITEDESTVEQLFKSLGKDYHPDITYNLQLTASEKELPDDERVKLCQEVDRLIGDAFTHHGQKVFDIHSRVWKS